MRKLLLLTFILGMAFGIFAQQKALPPKEIRNKMVPVEKPVKGKPDFEIQVTPGVKYTWVFDDEDIGNTWYDLQTNRSMQKRVHLHSDGTIGAVWTRGPEGNPGGPQRGTGYNFFDGDYWGPFPTAAIENNKQAGWPSYTTYGENGEAYVCHDYWDGTILGTRNVRGTGAWNLVLQTGPAGAEDISFPRIATSGINNQIIHILSTTWVSYNGQDAALLYARTSDGGATWDFENQIFSELGTDYSLDITPDTYGWAEPKNGLLAFLIGSNWMDLAIMKSYDDGDTWTKTVIWECPYPLHGGTPTDTFYCPDGSHDITIDNNGLVHVVFSLTQALHDGTSALYTPSVDGVVYWNENRPSFSNNINALNPDGHPDSELIMDYSLIGWSQDLNGNDTLDIADDWGRYNTGLSSQPQIVVDDMNRVFVFYASVTEGWYFNNANYRHIWARSSPNGGEYWGKFVDLNADPVFYLFTECVFPSVSTSSDDFIHLIYQADFEPGTYTTSIYENFIRYMKVPKDDLISGIKDERIIERIKVSQNYPNPCTDRSSVHVFLHEPAFVSLEVFNLMGQMVYIIPEQYVHGGNTELVINAHGLQSGVYFYTVKSGENAVTKKMIIR